MSVNPFLQMPRRRNTIEDALRRTSTGPTRPQNAWRSSVVESGEQGFEGRDDVGYLDQIRDVYLNEGPAQSAYRQHISNIPQQQPVGWGRKIGAALLGAGVGMRQGGAAGFQMANEVVQAPYRQQMEQWGMQEHGLRQAAALEDDERQRRIAYADQVRKVAKDAADFDRYMREYHLKEQERNDRVRHQQMTLEGQAEARYDNRLRWTAQDENADLAREQSGRLTRRGQDISAQTARRGQDLNYTVETERNQLTREGNQIRKDRPLGTNRNPILDSNRADQLAKEEVIRENPEFEKFIDQNGRYSDQKDPAGYRRFVEAVKKRKQQIMNPPVEIP